MASAAALRPHRGSVTASLGEPADLPFADASFDAVLLLGPLYHLTARTDRLRALTEAVRVVRPGGPVLAAAISRFASLLDGVTTGMLRQPAFRAIVERDVADGQHRNPTNEPRWFTTAYFHHPRDLAEEARAGLSPHLMMVGHRRAGG